MHKHRAIVIFLLKFFTTYFVLFGAYSFYLNKSQQKEPVFACAPITVKVAKHVEKIANMLGYEAYTEQNHDELSLRFVINDFYASRIIEGCNSISIIILFLAFIIAFSGGLWDTLWFGIFGSVLIYVVNVLRIIALSVLYYKFPEYQTVLHDLLFPSIIYGLTFVLWVTWVKFFSKLSKNG